MPIWDTHVYNNEIASKRFLTGSPDLVVCPCTEYISSKAPFVIIHVKGISELYCYLELAPSKSHSPGRRQAGVLDAYYARRDNLGG